MGIEAQLSQLFLEYAYDPLWLYAIVVGIMFASSCGLPLPEEVPLVGSGLAAYMATHPEIYPPPYPGAQGVNPYTLAIVCFFAVFASDFFIYWLGHYFGDKIDGHKYWGKKIKGKAFRRVQRWIKRYGNFAPCVFRFTPGLRFPGHLMCGAVGLSPWRFALTDGLAALLTVPIQILMVAHYGKVIIDFFSKAKYYIGGGALLFILATVVISWRSSDDDLISDDPSNEGNLE